MDLLFGRERDHEMKKACAIASFVKTPGLSPVKTRLAQSLGQGAAERFHFLSAKCLERAIADAQGEMNSIAPFWAVAELDGLGHSAWENFNRIYQGKGTLGERLARVYEELFREFENVILVGADSPQLTSAHLLQALKSLEKNSFVLGPASDGGFYLFGGRAPISREVWIQTPYSSDQTFQTLKASLTRLGDVGVLAELSDVDTVADLKNLLQNSNKKTLNAIQMSLLRWAEDLFFDKGPT
ncbi:MAG: TIGR04282 family arsenosugar biosynthesis glycosyltransferase [Parachlamydiales bacterium]